jgi:biotin carboxylase
MTTRIWINRAGPSRIHAMRMLRDNPDGLPVTIHATRTRADNPSQRFADVPGWEPGSDISDAEYGQFAVDYVRTHGIQVIIPTSRMTALASRAAHLADLGCTLLAPGAAVCELTDSKTATYDVAKELGVPVPPYQRVSGSAEFRDAVWALRSQGHTACVKPDTGWAASSFRIIDDGATTLESLLVSSRPVVDVETYATALSKARLEGKYVPDLIVMPFLDVPEVSVDLLCSNGQVLIAIPRRKSGFYREFHHNAEVIEHATTLARLLPLNHVANVQFRYLGGKPVLLEINPRPSAGTFHTEATGVNLYWEAIKQVIQPGSPVTLPQLGGRVLLHETALAV